ncbi:MAG: YaaR family protein [Tepidanaerobacteraceae bacterium]|nr:YaaR family protein [Tepidanaerobacteraceae bacterium]
MRVDLLPEYGLPKDILPRADRGHRSFNKHFEVAVDVHLRQQIDQELETIHEIGRRLSQSMSLADLKDYRQRIAKFLKMCISRGLCFKEENFPARYGRSKILSIVKTVNQKLLALAEVMLSENRDPLKAMALVDEIRGLLLDLYV